jgi:hypothetical protein
MALNLGNLTVERDVTVPKAKRGRNAQENPLLPLMKESLDNNYKGMKFPEVPANETREAVNLLRYAANAIGCGSRIVMHATDGRELELGRKEDENGEATGLDIVYKDESTTNYTGAVDILFRAAKRKERKNENGQMAAATETPETAPDIEPDTTEADSLPPAGQTSDAAETSTGRKPRRR